MPTKKTSKITQWINDNESAIRLFVGLTGLVLVLVGETFGKEKFEFTLPWAEKPSKFFTNMTQMLGYAFIAGPYIYKLAVMKLKANKQG